MTTAASPATHRFPRGEKSGLERPARLRWLEARQPALRCVLALCRPYAPSAWASPTGKSLRALLTSPVPPHSHWSVTDTRQQAVFPKGSLRPVAAAQCAGGEDCWTDIAGTAVGVAGKLLRVYVQDHHAAAAAGLNLARRLARENASTPFADELKLLADEIADDRVKLGAVLRALDVEPSRLKIGLARAAERAARLKLNGRALGYSPLSRVIELEDAGSRNPRKEGPLERAC